MLPPHCVSARPLPPALPVADRAKPPEYLQNLPIDALRQDQQDGTVMNESEKQFSFTRAASSTSGRAKTKYKTAMGQGTVGMDQAVNAAIKEGFQPYGNPYKVFHRGI